MRPKNEIYEAMTLGDHYEDDEALVMYRHFGKLSELLSELGQRFHFAFYEATQRYYDLRSVCKARKLI